MHTPVLLQSAIEALDVKTDGIYIDATAGEGGHTRELVSLGAKVLAIDRDKKQVKRLQMEYLNNPKVIIVNENFSNIEVVAKSESVVPVDGVLFDLGLSMMQLNEGNKGLSYKKDSEPLDMRLDETVTTTAADLVNTTIKADLYHFIARNSEEIRSGQIVDAIIEERKRRKIVTVGDLKSVINRAIGISDESVYRRIFQALRIEVNNEFENLLAGLTGSMHITKKGGRIAVITFHSAEDRMVKQFMTDKKLKSVYKKIITGDKSKKFEKSAKLRAIEL